MVFLILPRVKLKNEILGPMRKFVLFLIAACATAGAQDSASVRVPDIVKAGETVTFDITLDVAPNFDGGSVLVWVKGPGEFSIQSPATSKRESENVPIL
jgi:hypothetical protein